MAVLLDNNAFPRKVISVTDEVFKEHFKENGWSWYKRSGARIGKTNADAIYKELKKLVKEEEERLISDASV
jgi:hypothetical protein